MIHGDTRCTKRTKRVSIVMYLYLKCIFLNANMDFLSPQGYFGAIEHNFGVKVLGIVVNYFSHSLVFKGQGSPWITRI